MDKHKRNIFIFVGIGISSIAVMVWKHRKIIKYALSLQNKAYISLLNKDVKAKFTELVRKIEQKGYSVYVTSGYRGDSNGSMHQLGLALDINLINNKTGKRITMKDNTIQDWLDTGVPQIAEKMGFRWGGRFSTYKNMYGTFGDPVHFDYQFDKKNYTELLNKGIAQYGTKEKALSKYEKINYA